MSLRFRFLTVVFVCAIQPWLCREVSAVIKVELPLSKRYEVTKMVVIGKVTGVNPDLRVVEVTTEERLKGDGPATFRLQIVNPADLIKSVAVGQPVVLFTKLIASVHIADTWVSATPFVGKDPPVWRVTQIDKSAEPSFPGTTAALVRVLREMKAGKSTLLDAFEGKLFAGGAKEVAKLDVAKPTFLIRADVNGDGKPDLLVGTPQGVKLLLATADGYADATEKWGLAGASGPCAAAADVNGDGKIDLLIGKTLYLNDGQKFTPAGPAFGADGDAPALASALGDFTGSGKPDAALLLGDGRLLIFKNAGPGAAWAKEVDRKLLTTGPAPQAAVFGDFSNDGQPAVIVAQDNALTRFCLRGDEPPADFGRLTGDTLEKIKGFGGGLKNATLTRLDVNADHRPDVLITIDGASLVLINRGFGVFLPDANAAAEFNAAGGKGLPFALSACRARAAASSRADAPDDLLVLSEDGKLFSLSNP